MAAGSNLDKIRELGERLPDPEIATQMFEEMPDAVIVVDTHGIIQQPFVNRQAELLFGYARRELYDQPVTMLMSSDLKERHEGHVEGYFRDVPHVRPMGIGMKLEGIRKDGARFFVEISLGPIVTTRGMFTVAVIRKMRDKYGP